MQLIHQNGERLFVTSLDISNRFGKRHDDVLKAIRALECSPDFRRRNFAETVYHRPNPSGGKRIPAPMFEITRDGFTFLCMGFTGQQAALWKERYIEAFNMMEQTLRASSLGAAGAEAELTRLRAERDRLRQIALASNPLAVRLMRYRDMGLSLPEIGRLLGITGEAVRHRLKRLAEAGLIDYSPDPRMAAGGRLGQRTRMAQLRANPACIEQEPAQ